MVASCVPAFLLRPRLACRTPGYPPGGEESRSLPRSYLTGLNFLLNEQQDKAIDSFIEAVRIDPQTVELHFALGSLFRRRGETDRAIRMHQNLVGREDLSEEHRVQALAELGQDYLKAGLLDRAEAVFVQLKDTRLSDIASKYLLEFSSRRRIGRRRSPSFASCPSMSKSCGGRSWPIFTELAASAIADSRYDDAHRHLDDALAINRQCVRASLLRGELLAGQGQDDAALEVWKRVENQNPVYLAMVAEPMMEAYRRQDRVEAGLQLLGSWLEHHPSLDLLDEIFQWELERQGPRAAYELVREELRRNPTLLGLDKLLEAALLTAPAEQRHDIDLVKQLIHGPHAARCALSLRCLRIQGKTVLLAVSRLRWMGNLSAEADRGVRHLS